MISAEQVRARSSAARAQQAARLLDKLRALERQRRGKALLGRCLRLGARLSARLVHLGTTALRARHHVQDRRFHTLQLISNTVAHAAMRMACKAAPRSLLHTQITETGQGKRSGLLLHTHGQLRACLSYSARSSASAAAMRCSAAASAARASARAWPTWEY